MWRALILSTSALWVTACGGGGGGGSSGPSTMNVSMSGTAATGKAIANASVGVVCVRGSATSTSDANGNFNASVMGALPCLITVTSGATVLHSAALAGGTFNVTPETELMLDYLSAQVGTNIAGLFAGLSSNAMIQQVLGSASDIQNAESVVVQTLERNNALTLTTTAFLTQPFSVGQPGEDADLELLNTAGVLDTNGMPVASTTNAVTAAGAANPIPSSIGTTSGGSGGSGGQSGGTSGMGGMSGGMM